MDVKNSIQLIFNLMKIKIMIMEMEMEMEMERMTMVMVMVEIKESSMKKVSKWDKQLWQS